MIMDVMKTNISSAKDFFKGLRLSCQWDLLKNKAFSFLDIVLTERLGDENSNLCV